MKWPKKIYHEFLDLNQMHRKSTDSDQIDIIIKEQYMHSLSSKEHWG